MGLLKYFKYFNSPIKVIQTKERLISQSGKENTQACWGTPPFPPRARGGLMLGNGDALFYFITYTHKLISYVGIANTDYINTQ